MSLSFKGILRVETTTQKPNLKKNQISTKKIQCLSQYERLEPKWLEPKWLRNDDDDDHDDNRDHDHDQDQDNDQEGDDDDDDGEK